MDIVKTATDWARAEMLSSSLFIASGAVFLMASYGFWSIGKTDVARAYIGPTMIAGVLLLVIGLGLFFPSLSRVSSFPVAYSADPVAFVAAQIEKADTILNQYRIAVLVIPIIVAVCAIAIIAFDGPLLRASAITVIAMMAVILMLDTSAQARLETFKEHLVMATR